ncbi:MAG: hypothetical protein KC620_05030 [Myxococcales bacterium]|nr:hypothetical protein [Myxococcales bacterium]
MSRRRSRRRASEIAPIRRGRGLGSLVAIGIGLGLILLYKTGVDDNAAALFVGIMGDPELELPPSVLDTLDAGVAPTERRLPAELEEDETPAVAATDGGTPAHDAGHTGTLPAPRFTDTGPPPAPVDAAVVPPPDAGAPPTGELPFERATTPAPVADAGTGVAGTRPIERRAPDPALAPDAAIGPPARLPFERRPAPETALGPIPDAGVARVAPLPFERAPAPGPPAGDGGPPPSAVGDAAPAARP